MGNTVSSLHASTDIYMLSGRRGNVKVDYWTPDNTDAKYPKPRIKVEIIQNRAVRLAISTHHT